MPHKSAIEKLEAIIREEYQESLNSINNLAERTGLSRSSVSRMIDRLLNEEEIFKSERTAEKYIERIESAERQEFLSGPNEMTLDREIEGPNYLIQDYILEPGASLPQEVTDNATGYQIIIKGREEGDEEDSQLTTNSNIDAEGALEEAESLSGRYGKFSGGVIIMRVFIPA